MLLGSHHEVTDIPGLRQLCRLKLLLQKKTPPKKSSKAHLFKNHHHAYYEMATSTLLGMAYIGSFLIIKFDFIATFYALKAALRSGL